MKINLTILALLGALAVSGCESNDFARRLLKRKPTAEEASGTYVLAVVNVDQVEAGLSQKITTQQPPPTIELKADGTAEVHDFPMFSDSGNYNYRFAGFTSFKAGWRILPVGNVSSDGNSADVFGITMDSTDSADTKQKLEALSFTGKSTPDGLVFTLYDGSQGQILEFAKQATEAAPTAEQK
jgi:hypothetical protein